MSVAEFWSDYDIVYGYEAKNRDKMEETRIICLKNNEKSIETSCRPTSKTFSRFTQMSFINQAMTNDIHLFKPSVTNENSNIVLLMDM